MTVDAVAALEIGGTHVAAGRVDLNARAVLADRPPRSTLRPGAGRDELLADFARSAAAVVAPDAPLGVAIPGPFDYERGIGSFAGVAKFDALSGVDLRAALRRRLDPAPAFIAFLNDADAFALGEWLAGAAAGHERAVGITLGTGMGSGFVADGRIVDRGPEVPPEGNIHLLTIDGRPLEDTVSTRAIAARYAALSRTAGLDVRGIADRARAGDTTASLVFDDAIGALGRAIAPWLTRFGATVLVVGGSIARSWDLVEPALRRGLEASAGSPSLRLARAANPEDAGLIGAAHHADALTQAGRSRHSGGTEPGGARRHGR